jgi:peptidoglycan/xylan/chitin deacetylase (PgdA/CDA1 family)
MRKLIAAGAATWTAPALAPLWPGLRGALRIPGSIDDRAVVCLTFDDGPHRRGTPAIVDQLDRAGVRATFFVVGEQVRNAPSLVAELAAAGHAVELHGDTHRNHLRLSPAAVADDLRRGADAIATVTGRPPRLHRPPYGIYSAGSLAVARRLGLAPLLWSRWGRDWRHDATPDGIARLVSADPRGGDVLLLHDSDAYGASGSWRATTAALPRVLETVARHGLDCVPVPEPS